MSRFDIDLRSFDIEDYSMVYASTLPEESIEARYGSVSDNLTGESRERHQNRRFWKHIYDGNSRGCRHILRRYPWFVAVCIVHNTGVHVITPLGLAVRRNQLGVINVLTENVNIYINDFDINDNRIPLRHLNNVEKKHSLNPLLMAAVFGHWQIARSLLEGGANPDIQNGAGETAMHLAFAEYGGRPCIVEVLLQQGVDMSLHTNEGWKAVHYACLFGNVYQVQVLLDADPLLHLVRGVGQNGGATPLHCAAQSGNVEIMQLLLEANADVNARDDNGYSPVYYSILHSQDACLLELLNYGATPSMQDSHETLLHTAVTRLRHTTLIPLMRRLPVNEVDQSGNTPLMLACKARADLNSIIAISYAGKLEGLKSKNKRGLTAFHVCVASNNLEAAKIVYFCGVEADSCNTYDETPLHLAVKNSFDSRLVSYLLSLPKTDPNSFGGVWLYSPLHYVCMSWYRRETLYPENLRTPEQRNIVIFDMLVKAGADITLTDELQHTCLHYACESRQNQLVKAICKLMEHWPLEEKLQMLNQPSYHNETPIELAAKRKCVSVMSTLLLNGVDMPDQMPSHLSGVMSVVASNGYSEEASQLVISYCNSSDWSSSSIIWSEIESAFSTIEESPQE